MLLKSARDFTLFTYFQMMSTNDALSSSTASGSGSKATDDVALLKAEIAILEAEVAAKANGIPVPEKTIVGIPVTTNVEESQLLTLHGLKVVSRFYIRRRRSSQIWHQENVASLLQQEDAC